MSEFVESRGVRVHEIMSEFVESKGVRAHETESEFVKSRGMSAHEIKSEFVGLREAFFLSLPAHLIEQQGRGGRHFQQRRKKVALPREEKSIRRKRRILSNKN